MCTESILGNLLLLAVQLQNRCIKSVDTDGRASLRIVHDQMIPRHLIWPDHVPLFVHTWESCLLHSPLLLHFQQVQQCPEVGMQPQAAGGGG